jgi:hypothetical protein
MSIDVVQETEISQMSSIDPGSFLQFSAWPVSKTGGFRFWNMAHRLRKMPQALIPDSTGHGAQFRPFAGPRPKGGR